jgi:hypothetical protein
MPELSIDRMRALFCRYLARKWHITTPFGAFCKLGSDWCPLGPCCKQLAANCQALCLDASFADMPALSNSAPAALKLPMLTVPER